MRKLLAATSLLFVPFALFAQGPSAASPAEITMVKAVDAETPAAVALLEKMVNINSGTMNLAGVVKVKDVMQPEIEALGFKTRWIPMDQLVGRAGVLVAEHACPAGGGKCGKRMLLIGHMDTVFEPTSSFQRYATVPGTNGNVVTGPGVDDMKGGLVVMLTALKAMKTAGVLDKSEMTIVLSGDEERFGKPGSVSRRDMIEAAKHSDLALEFEGSGRVDGKDGILLGRRSSISWHIETTGKTGHSSRIFSEAMGYGAIYELTRILDEFRRELPEHGLTFNVGLILGGATSELNKEDTGGDATGKVNIIPPIAMANGDIRTLDDEQTIRVKKKMEAIVRDHLARTGATIEFAEGYPAMGVTAASEAILTKLQGVNDSLGLPRLEVRDPIGSGGGDIAFVAPYVPGLVGVGIVGAGAHAEGETAYLDSVPTQAKRMAVLMYRLAQER